MTKRHRSGNRSTSAAEFLAELQRDPEFSARQKLQEEKRRQNVEDYRMASRDLRADLAAAGFEVDAIQDLRRRGTPYPGAVPVLMRWLPRIQAPFVREDIVRTLSVPWAQEAAPVLLAEFERAEDATGSGIRWVIGNALEVIAHDGIADDMIELATDRRFGRDREMVVLGLGKLSVPRVTDVLLGLLADDDVAGHAVMALGTLRAKRARSRIEPFLKHPKSWIRVEAAKALAAIDKGR